MRAPAFWSNPPERPGWQARALGPAAAFWRAGAWARGLTARPPAAAIPVICVGNLTAGGAGKTPMVAALVQRIAGAGIPTHIVSRGYGGWARGPHRVDPERDTFRDVGDEPMMLSALAPVWVSRDRAAGVRAAAAEGAKLVLLDDGFQNPFVRKDASILMIDAVQGFGNGKLIPAGPLREPVARGLARADLVILVGPPPARTAALARWPALERAGALGAELRPVETGMSLEGERVVAFAGIGRPEKFFATLRGMGVRLIGTRAFPDHHAFSTSILRRMIARARREGAMLVTTEKDAFRLPPELRGEVLTVQVRIEPEDWGPIDALIGGVLPEGR